MKRNRRTTQWPSRLSAVALLALGIALPASAATLPIQGRIELRPLTPQEKKDYSLTTLQGASGLNTIGLGQPAYLEVLVSKDIPAAEITNVSWSVSLKPIGSQADLGPSPLGANVPTYKMVDRQDAIVADRRVLSPDMIGQYTVAVTVDTVNNGSTNLTQKITAATYMGINACTLCHSGGIQADDKYHPWLETGHATFFTRALDGGAGDHYAAYCISCHTVGYDANTNAVNGGFDDIAKQLGWTFPTELTNGNWAALPDQLKNLSNIQCENCHGPGSEHATGLGSPDKISVSFASADCAQCHDSKPQHVRSAEWNNSGHAVAPEETEAGCVRCHSAKGFADYAGGKPAVATPYEVITCSACHEPHSDANPGQLRTVAPVTLMDKTTTISNGGVGQMCMNCHMSRRDAKTYVETTAGSARFGPHHGPQADMLAGANAVTYGKEIPSSAHKDVVEDSCAACHMQETEMTSAAWTKVGGHTFKMSWPGEGTNAPVHMTGACVDCHGEIENFDFARQDYDGDGVMEGVQTEVRGLLDRLAYMLPPVGVAKTNHSPTNIAINNTWSRPQLRAGYNYLFVVEDGSYGIHNLAYAVGLLKASIADLSGDSNNDTLPDSWQVQYFGSANNPSAAPNATPAGDGIPNWLKYSLNLDPTVAGVVMPDGVVWVNGKNTSVGDTNTVAIYTAAEVVFNTEVGKSYQIQSTSSFSGGWQNVGAPIQGTGSPVSYVTPTRDKVQQFYRVETK